MVDQAEHNKTQFHDWILLHNVNMNCSSCGDQQWGIGDMVALPTVQGKTADIDKARIFLPTTCKRCGLIRLFDAMTIGLWSSQS